MEIKYPQLVVNKEAAFLSNEDLTNYLQNLYWETTQVKNSLSYTPDTHAQYQYTMAKLEGKQEALQELLSNFN